MKTCSGRSSNAKGFANLHNDVQVLEMSNSPVNCNGVREDFFVSTGDNRINLSRNEPKILLFSAADEAGVKRLVDAYEDYFSKTPSLDREAENQHLADLAYTLFHRRSKLPWKSYSVIKTLEHLRTGFANNLPKPVRSSTTPPSISYIFTGQGAQWHAMAHGLNVYPVFLESLQRSQKYLKDQDCEWTLTGMKVVFHLQQLLIAYR